MKASITSEEIRGVLFIELKYINCRIEFKWFRKGNQLNLRLENIQYKMKEALERRKHALDYLKDKPKKFILEKILQSDLLVNQIKKKPKVVWWTQ